MYYSIAVWYAARDGGRRIAPWLSRLTTWLEGFESVFAHRAQRGGLRRYVEGVLCDSRRKSMAAMWARLRDPGTYQGLQYFITEATWDAAALWRQLRRGFRRAPACWCSMARLPEARAASSESNASTPVRWARSAIARCRHGRVVHGRSGVAGRRATVLAGELGHPGAA